MRSRGSCLQGTAVPSKSVRVCTETSARCSYSEQLQRSRSSSCLFHRCAENGNLANTTFQAGLRKVAHCCNGLFYLVIVGGGTLSSFALPGHLNQSQARVRTFCYSSTFTMQWLSKERACCMFWVCFNNMLLHTQQRELFQCWMSRQNRR